MVAAGGDSPRAVSTCLPEVPDAFPRQVPSQPPEPGDSCPLYVDVAGRRTYIRIHSPDCRHQADGQSLRGLRIAALGGAAVHVLRLLHDPSATGSAWKWRTWLGE